MSEKISAVAVVTDRYMMFDSDETLVNWVTQILRAKWMDAKAPKAERIEVTMRFKGNDDEIKVQLEKSLQNVMKDAHLKWQDPKKEVFSVNSPAMKAWCMVAIGSVR